MACAKIVGAMASMVWLGVQSIKMNALIQKGTWPLQQKAAVVLHQAEALLHQGLTSSQMRTAALLNTQTRQQMHWLHFTKQTKLGSRQQQWQTF